MTEISVGTARPVDWMPLMAPSAMRSDPQMIPVHPCSARAAPAVAPPS